MVIILLCPDFFTALWVFLFQCCNRQATINTFVNILYLGLHSSLNFNVDHDFGFPQLNEHDRETLKMRRSLNQILNVSLHVPVTAAPCITQLEFFRTSVDDKITLKDKYTTKLKCLP